MTRSATLHRSRPVGVALGRHEAVRPVVWPSAGWMVVFDLILLIGGLTIMHVIVSGPIPSGGDGGNWLALAREWLGESVMSADVVYEPVFIGLLASLLGVLGLVNGLVVSALVAEAVLIAAVYLLMRKTGRVPALLASALVGVAGYRLEAYAWGAYPQILALGLGLLAVWAVVRYTTYGGWGRLLRVSISVVAVLLTHKLVGGLMLMAVPAAALHTVWRRGGFRRPSLTWAGIVVGLTWAIGALFFYSWFGSSGLEPTLNALGLSRVEQLQFAFQEASVPWLAVTILALVGLAFRSWPATTAPVVSTSFGWLIASIAGFVVLAEPRVLIQAQVAMVPLAALVLWRWWDASRGASGIRRVGRISYGFLAIALLGSVVLTGLHRYELASDWYRVAGQRELEALSALSEVAEPGDLAVASKGPNGNPLGWWVEGYAGIPTYTSIDPAFLAFPDEVAQAAAADEIFSAPPEEAARMLEEIGARFLILDRRGPDVGWLADGEPVGLTSLSDGTLLIMEVSDGP